MLKRIEPLKLPTAPAIAAAVVAVEQAKADQPPETISDNKPLKNAKHEQFAQVMARGKSATTAYREVYAPDTDKAAWNGGHKLAARHEIKARIRHIQRKAADDTVMDLQEHRRFLARIVRTPVGEVDEQSDLCQAHERDTVYTKSGDVIEKERFKVPNKIAALELDAKLAGYLGSDVNPDEARLPNNMTTIIQVVNQFISGEPPMKTLPAA